MKRILLATAAILASAAEPAGSWRAGVAVATITPEKPMWLSGYAGRTRPADGKLGDLFAKALVVEDPTGRRAVVVTMDLVGIARELAAGVCEELKAKYKLPREAVFLSVSHTHSGPVIRGNLASMYNLDATQMQLVEEYSDTLKTKLVGVVGQAVDDLAAADLAHGRGYVTFAVNRRNNKEGDVPKLRAAGRLKGPVDHDLPVLSVRAKDGKLRAVLFGYACHATVLSGYEWSADYPGYAQAAVEQMNPGAVALFFAGCGADQNPLPRRTAAIAKRYGEELARGVDNVLKAPMAPVGGRLGLSYAEVDLPFADLPSRERLLAGGVAEQPPTVNRARKFLTQLEKGVPLPASYPYPVQAWRLGPHLSLATLGGEVVVDYSLRLKREFGRESLWVAGYANDVMAYIPSLRVLNEGGYEGGGSMPIYGLPAVWGPRVEEIVVAAVHKQLAAAKPAD